MVGLAEPLISLVGYPVITLMATHTCKKGKRTMGNRRFHFTIISVFAVAMLVAASVISQLNTAHAQTMNDERAAKVSGIAHLPGRSGVIADFTPDWDYRIVKMQHIEDESWTIGVHKVWYYPDSNKTRLFDVTEYPVPVEGTSWRKVRRALLNAYTRDVLVFPLVEIRNE